MCEILTVKILVPHLIVKYTYHEISRYTIFATCMIATACMICWWGSMCLFAACVIAATSIHLLHVYFCCMCDACIISCWGSMYIFAASMITGACVYLLYVWFAAEAACVYLLHAWLLLHVCIYHMCDLLLRQVCVCSLHVWSAACVHLLHEWFAAEAACEFATCVIAATCMSLLPVHAAMMVAAWCPFLDLVLSSLILQMVWYPTFIISITSYKVNVWITAGKLTIVLWLHKHTYMS